MTSNDVSQTLEQSIHTATAQYITTVIDQHVLPQITIHLKKTYNIDVACEQLRTVLSIEAKEVAPVTPMIIQRPPGLLSSPFAVQTPQLNGPITALADIQKSAPKKRAAADPNKEGCRYVFTRGAKSGQYCNIASLVEGTQFCRTCIKKSGALGANAAVPAKKAKAVGGMANGLIKPTTAPYAGVQQPQPPASNSLDVEELIPGKLYLTNTGLVIVPTADGGYVVQGAVITKGDHTNLRELSAQEKQMAIDIGLSLPESDNEAPGARP